MVSSGGETSGLLEDQRAGKSDIVVVCFGAVDFCWRVLVEFGGFLACGKKKSVLVRGFALQGIRLSTATGKCTSFGDGGPI